eukprot:6124463-Amphidinium_carterae.1
MPVKLHNGLFWCGCDWRWVRFLCICLAFESGRHYAHSSLRKAASQQLDVSRRREGSSELTVSKLEEMRERYAAEDLQLVFAGPIQAQPRRVNPEVLYNGLKHGGWSLSSRDERIIEVCLGCVHLSSAAHKNRTLAQRRQREADVDEYEDAALSTWRQLTSLSVSSEHPSPSLFVLAQRSACNWLSAVLHGTQLCLYADYAQAQEVLAVATQFDCSTSYMSWMWSIASQEGLATIAKYGPSAAVMPEKVAERVGKRGVVLGGSFYFSMLAVFGLAIFLFKAQVSA